MLAIFAMLCFIQVLPAAIIDFSLTKFSTACAVTGAVLGYTLLQTTVITIVVRVLKSRGNEIQVPSVPMLKD